MANDLSRALVTSILSTDQVVFITDPGGTPVNVRITLADWTNIVFDTSPTLGGNLNPNGFLIANTSVSPEIPVLGFNPLAGKFDYIQISSGDGVSFFTAPTFTAVGPSTNIGINFIPKGTGAIFYLGDVIHFAGDYTLQTGDYNITSGDMNITSGDLLVLSGEVRAASGGVAALNTNNLGNIILDDHIYDASGGQKLLNIFSIAGSKDQLSLEWEQASPDDNSIPILTVRGPNRSPNNKDMIIKAFGSGGRIRLQSDLMLEGTDILDANGNTIVEFLGITNAVNHVFINNNSTGVGPAISPEGPATNIDFIIAGKGTGEIWLATSVLALASVRIQAGNLTVSSGDVVVSNGDFDITQGKVQADGATGSVILNSAGAAGIGDIRLDDHFYDASTGQELLIFDRTLIGDNHIRFAWSGALTDPILTVDGPNASPNDIGLVIQGKNNGNVSINSKLIAFQDIQLGASTVILDNNGNTILDFLATGGADNYLQIGNTTGTQVAINAVGADANVGLVFNTQGTGNFQFNAGHVIIGGIFATGDIQTLGDFVLSVSGAIEFGNLNTINDALGNAVFSFDSTAGSGTNHLQVTSGGTGVNPMIRLVPLAPLDRGIDIVPTEGGFVHVRGVGVTIGGIKISNQGDLWIEEGDILDQHGSIVLGLARPSGSPAPSPLNSNYLTVASAAAGAAPIFSVDGPTVSPDDIDLQIEAKNNGDVLFGSSIAPLNNTTDFLGTASRKWRRIFVANASVGTPRANFSGIRMFNGAFSDSFIGDDNVFPGFYAQRVTFDDSTANDNTEDYSNLYQGDNGEPHIYLNWECRGDSIEFLAPMSTTGMLEGGVIQGFYDTANQKGGAGILIHGRARSTGTLLQHESLGAAVTEFHIRASSTGMGAVLPSAIRLGGDFVTHVSPIDSLGAANDDAIDLGFLGDTSVSPIQTISRWRTGYFSTDIEINSVSVLKKSKEITIDPVPEVLDRTWFFTDRALTVKQVEAVVRGGSPLPTITLDIKYAADRSAAGTSILAAPATVTSQTTGDSLTIGSPEVVIAADSWVWIEATDSPAGFVDELSLTLIYKEI